MENDQKIAVIGLSCRFPGANSVADFWQNLLEKKVAMSVAGKDIVGSATLDLRLTNQPNYIPAVYSIDDAEKFDASFFYLSAKEAEKMDPQLRVFLQETWRALEHSGYNSENFEGAIGVFASGLSSSYLLANLLPSKEHYHGDVHLLLQDMIARMGNDPNYLATRTAYHLNLTGPSVSVQTACSSSLVAVHLAAEALLSGQCDIALAGGVSIRYPSKAGYIYQADGILSADGYCRPFDAKASGTVFGDGCGVIVLKRLEDAINDRDTIHAVIDGSAIGNDGANRAGYTAPGVNGQISVLEQALSVSGLEKIDVDYIEAHGTGTLMGDPIEVSALNQVYGQQLDRVVHLGSVKGNIGHLSVASGIAGLIKCILMLKNRQLVATANFESPNAQCQFDSTPFIVATEACDWQKIQGRRVAAVSSFGMGGTNTHVLLSEAPEVSELAGDDRGFHLIPLSAKSPQALGIATENAIKMLETTDMDLADIAYTYAVGRRTFNYRNLILATDRQQAIAALSKLLPAKMLTGDGQPSKKNIVFMFSGQGAQYINMALECYERDPVFRQVVDDCSKKLEPELALDLREILWPKRFPTTGDITRINQTQYTQPALFVIEYALNRLWASWGIHANALIGHSIGEYVAACIAGVFSLDDALKIVANRGRLVQQLPPGSMAAVQLPKNKLLALLPAGVDIAAVNEPNACTVAGPKEAVSAFIAEASLQGIAVREIPTSHAFHSAMMDPAQDALKQVLRGITLSSPRTPIISNLTGAWLTDAQATDPQYWAEHLRNTVEFAAGIQTLLAMDVEQIFIEMGPGQTLASFVRRHPDKETNHSVFTSLGRVKKPEEEYQNLLTTFGRLWLNGHELSWIPFYGQQQRQRVPLPTYPFEEKLYLAEPDAGYLTAQVQTSDRKQPIENWCYQPIWQQSGTYSQAENEWPTSYLVLADDSMLTEELTRQLTATGRQITLVRKGENYAAISEREFTLQPHSKDDFTLLFETLGQQHALPDVIVQCWGESLPVAGLSRDLFERAQYFGAYTIVAVTQALGILNITQPIRYLMTTRDAYSVIGDEQLRPEQSTAAVLSRVQSQEYAHIDGRVVDLSESVSAENAASALLFESIVAAPREYAVAYRKKTRWIQTMKRVEQPETWAFEKHTRLEQRGRYLITGGLGEIGSTLATMLAEKYQARITLLVREQMPERNQWDGYLQVNNPDDLIYRRINTVRRLESIGGEVLIVRADIANEQEVQNAVDQATEHFSGLDGVIHAAGLPGEIWDRTIANAGLDEVRWHYQTKAYGVQVLARVLKPLTPKFVLFISSIASMLGGLRLGPYGAANHYMDNMAALLNETQPDTFWVAIDWDVWQHHQDEKRENSALGMMMDERTVLPAQGLETIERVLAMNNIHQISVSTWDMEVRADRWIKLTSLQAGGEHIDSTAVYMSGVSTDLDILALLQNTLGNENLGMEDDFFEAGGDSLVSVQILAKVREIYAVDVSLADFLSEPTASNLAFMVDSKFKIEDDVLSLITEEFTAQQQFLIEQWLDEIESSLSNSAATI